MNIQIFQNFRKLRRGLIFLPLLLSQARVLSTHPSVQPRWPGAGFPKMYEHSLMLERCISLDVALSCYALRRKKRVVVAVRYTPYLAVLQ